MMIDSPQPSVADAIVADVDSQRFAQLEAILQQGLYADNHEPVIAQLQTLLAEDPVTVRPLTALGIDTSDCGLTERLHILQRCYPALLDYKNHLGIKVSLLPEIFNYYLPLAIYMVRCSDRIRKSAQRAAVIGINGSQGSGKTTINAFLQIILQHGFGKTVAAFSIDDVYKTYEQRQQMASTVHPLFGIRSVPGTHDVPLAIDTIAQLRSSTAATRTAIPRFDKMARKGAGDRVPECNWPVIAGQVDLVLFEGWCVGARAEPDRALSAPINEREAREDPQGVWRRTANRLLQTDYQQLFACLDELVVIQVRSMEDVYRNREQQEQQLRRELVSREPQGDGELGAMTPQQVIDFIALYERITRYMLKTLPDAARVTLFIGEHHRVERVRVNHCNEAAQIT